MNKAAIIGSGYVGLVTGACLSDFGLNVICVDNNDQRIADLQNGIVPIYEPGLETLIEKNVENKRLSFTTDLGTGCLMHATLFLSLWVRRHRRMAVQTYSMWRL